MSESSVPWDRLPHDAAGFFELEPGFGRRDLKRAYNARIRVYKPERDPEAFKRIRAAYEQLDAELRYGRAEPYAVEPAGSAAADVDESVAVDERAALAARIAADGADAVYRELVEREPKSTTTYYALALLSDVVEPNDPIAFGRHLLDGLAAQSDWSLSTLFFEYAHEIGDTDARIALLRHAASVLRAEHYYYTTEALWLELATEVDFATWRTLFETLEADVRGSALPARLAFTARTTRALLFRADDAWVEERMSMLAEDIEQTPIPEWEFDELEMLNDYRRKRSAFLDGNPVRERIDRLLGRIASGDEPVIDREFLALQQSFVDEPDALFEAMSCTIDGDEAEQAMWWPYLVASRDVAQRTIDDADSLGTSVLPTGGLPQVRAFLNRIERLTDQSNEGGLWNLGILLYGALWLAAITGFLLTPFYLYRHYGTHLSTPMFALSGFVVCAVMVALAYVVVRRVGIVPLLERFSSRRAGRLYRKLWRKELIALIRDTQLTDVQIEYAIANHDFKGITNDGWLLNHMRSDYGIALYSIALRFAG